MVTFFEEIKLYILQMFVSLLHMGCHGWQLGSKALHLPQWICNVVISAFAKMLSWRIVTLTSALPNMSTQRWARRKCHMEERGRGHRLWFTLLSLPQSWHASVAITTPPWVAFLSHQRLSSLLSVGAFFGHGTPTTSSRCLTVQQSAHQ